MRNHLFVFLLCLICSGKSFSQSERGGNRIDYDSTPVLGKIYVTNRNGAEIKQEADSLSATLGAYPFGEQLEVIEEGENWIGIRERITREYVHDDVLVESTAWEKVYVSKAGTGPLDSVVLIPEDLNIISSIYQDDNSEYMEERRELEGRLAIELIGWELFESKKNEAVDFFVADTSRFPKQNGVIRLKCERKIKKYVDNPVIEESISEYHYIGQIPALNMYLVTGFYWESMDVKFIDKTSGEEVMSFGEFPYLSPDRKHIIAIYPNPYETTADLELYAVEDNKISHIFSTSFKNWMPAGYQPEIFWSKDNYLYISVNHSFSFWKGDGNLNDKCQYIRIRIL